MSDWWADELHPDLSHGDVIEFVPIASLVAPLSPLRPAPVTKGGGRTWEPFQTELPGTSLIHFLARGNLFRVIVLSHDCELDKDKSKKRVLVAPIAYIEQIPILLRDNLLAQRQRSKFPMVDVPGLGDVYADLRSMNSVDRALVASGKRLATLSKLGRERLRAQVVDFLFHIADDAPAS